MAKPLKRSFKYSDDVMLERARMFADGMETELSAFTARFPWMDAGWLSQFRTDIDAADAFPKDRSVRLDIKVLTGDLKATMRQGLIGLKTLDGYARLAWPNDRSRQRVFGQDGWKLTHNNSLRMQEALELAHAQANSDELRPDLMAKGYAQADIDTLGALSAQLQLINLRQEAAKQDRMVASHDRLALVNRVWGHMQTLNTCASIVWAADAGRLGRYDLYPMGFRNRRKAVTDGEGTSEVSAAT
jgi:hypothetical protein